MAHFAELNENNEVLRVIVVHNAELLDEQGQESEQKGIDFCINLLGGRWIQTSYNSTIRKNFAGIGFLYDPVNDWFQSPKPFPSWTLDSNAKWQAPTPMPSDDKRYKWDEDTTTWVEVLAL
jgi:hypothetical protein